MLAGKRGLFVETSHNTTCSVRVKVLNINLLIFLATAVQGEHLCEVKHLIK